MSELKTKEKELVTYVEKSLTDSSGLINETKSINYNVNEDEMVELNQALEKAKDSISLVPNPTSSIGKFFYKKSPKLYIWIKEAIGNKKFADESSLGKLEIIIEEYDQTFKRLYSNIEPIKQLKNKVEDKVEKFKFDIVKIVSYLDENPDTPSKEFLELHKEKLKGTVKVLESNALRLLENNITSRMKMFATAISEREQLEITLVVGINTLKSAKEVKLAADTQKAARSLTNQLATMSAEADREMTEVVEDVTTSTIFTMETIKKIKEETELGQKNAESIRLQNTENVKELAAELIDYEPLKIETINEEEKVLVSGNKEN